MTNSRRKGRGYERADLEFYASIGFTTGEAAKLLGTSGSAIRHHARKMGVKFPNKRALYRRFHESYRIDQKSGCWVWTGANRGNGYGCITNDGKLLLAHRVSFELFAHPIPDGMVICHKCDNRECVNPRHLFLGTHRDNMRDMHNKGRARPPSGEGHHASKLSREDVLEIRASSAPGVDLSKKYSVAQSAISKIRNGLLWKDVGGLNGQV